MKEKSVVFYKRLIIFTTLLILISIACLLTLFIGNGLNLGDGEGKDEENIVAGSNSVTQKTTKPAVEDEKKSTEGSLNVPVDPIPSEDMGKIQGKVVYLTFDDGASSNTPQILEILKENEIEATFFFNTGERQTPDSIIKEAYDMGNAIGVLTSATYNYDTIYSSVESYLEDFDKSYNRIYEVTGEKPCILRFPGGSINDYNKGNYKELIEEVTSRELVYFDWNVCGQDGNRNTSKDTIVANATKLPAKKDKCIVLMHDNGNDNTCAALREVIRFYKDNGYDFQRLTADVEPITF